MSLYITVSVGDPYHDPSWPPKAPIQVNPEKKSVTEIFSSFSVLQF